MTEETRDEVKTKVPKSIPFILVNVFLERYCTSGVLGEFKAAAAAVVLTHTDSSFSHINYSAILPLFLHNKMGFDKNTSTSIFHVYEGMTLLFTVAGAILADTWMGLYRSIIIMSSVYTIGFGIIAVGMIEPLNLPVE
jgi:solute carrier family 15 oligopeptide transporter 1